MVYINYKQKSPLIIFGVTYVQVKVILSKHWTNGLALKVFVMYKVWWNILWQNFNCMQIAFRLCGVILGVKMICTLDLLCFFLFIMVKTIYISAFNETIQLFKVGNTPIILQLLYSIRNLIGWLATMSYQTVSLNNDDDWFYGYVVILFTYQVQCI